MLERDSIIAAVRGKGFYINRTDIIIHHRILLIFNKLSEYKKIIYESFVNTLGGKATVDLKIHHCNAKLLQEIINKSAGKYDYYVVMPHFYDQTEEACNVLQQIPEERLLLLDKDLPLKHTTSVYQDFEADIIEALESGIDALRKYEKLICVHPVSTPYPAEIVSGFKKFCNRYNFRYSVTNEIKAGDSVQKGEAYVVIEETDLASVIKSCRSQQLVIGKDVGILSYNETPIKELLANGVSVISTNHCKMGETAARMILEQRSGKIKNPFRLILRNSL
jgi:DNA-binding LacI/PurR family transcriptional regulator